MDPIMQYPVFEANQVLTANNLNETIHYLDQQDLSTRRNLIGIGIVCGFNFKTDLSSYITLEGGCGVTSMGHLISAKKMKLEYYRSFIDRATVPYSKFIAPSGSQYPMWELLTQTEYDEADDPTVNKALTTVTGFSMAEMVLVLYLEITDEDLKDCIGQSCDEQGKKRRFYLRKLLVKKTDMLAIIRKSEELAHGLSEADIYSDIYPGYNLQSVKNHRLNYNLADLSSLNLGLINTWQKLKKAFKDVIGKDVVKIGSALYESYELFKSELKELYNNTNPFTGFNLPASTNKLLNVIKISLNDEELEVQYAYDFLCDLVKAYEEFCEVAVEFRSLCCPNPNLFPFHLMLGCLQKTGAKTDKLYRHHWQPSPAVTGLSNKMEHLRFLHHKIVLLSQNFNPQLFTKSSQIKITPGKFTASPLSEHSIPFYYFKHETVTELVAYWNYLLNVKNQTDTNLSYFAQQYSAKPFAVKPLLYSLRDYEFFRIEGHLGQELKTVENALLRQIRDFNLPFDTISIKLSADHLDVEVEDHCFQDLQAIYKTNRDEYLSCINSLSTLINLFVELISRLARLNPGVLDMQLNQKEGQISFVTNLRQLFIILQMYAFFLNRIKTLLPEHIKDFDYQKFKVTYFIVYAFTLFGQILLEYLSNLIEQFSASFLQVMLLKTLFARLIDDCMDAKFKSIYDQYHERLLRTQLGRLFPGFVTGSPGMEHLAGVKEGGTFVLVYDEMPEQEIERIPPQRIPPKEEDDDCIENDEAKKLRLDVLQYAYVITNEPVLLNELNSKIDLNNFSRFHNFEEYKKGATGTESENIPKEKIAEERASGAYQNLNQSHTEKRVSELRTKYPDVTSFLEFLFGRLDEEKEEERKVYRVVADFAIPFRCCKSCLQVEELPETEVSIEINPRRFCYRDRSGGYPVIVSPDGGELTSSDGGITESAPYAFHPSQTSGNEEEIILTYTVEGVSATTSVMIFNPVADFRTEITWDDSGLEIVHFINQSKNADRYLWRIEEIEYETQERDFTFPRLRLPQSELTVTLIAYRNQCESGPVTQTLDLTQEQAILELQQPKGNENYQYCNNDGIRYYFRVTPLGEAVEGDPNAIQTDADGNYFFVPSGLAPGEYVFRYMNAPEITAQVFEPAQIGFSYEIIRVVEDNRVLIEFQFTGDFHGYITWVFGDDSESIATEEQTVRHLYNPSTNTVFEVGLRMSNNNGICVSEYIETIDLSEYVNNGPGLDFELVHFDPGSQLSVITTSDERDMANITSTFDLEVADHWAQLENELRTNTDRRERFFSGELNREIDQTYSTALDGTYEEIKQQVEVQNQRALNYLVPSYIKIMEEEMALLANTKKDIAKQSNVYKNLMNRVAQLQELKEQGIDINEKEAFRSMIEKSRESLQEKPALLAVVQQLKTLQ